MFINGEQSIHWHLCELVEAALTPKFKVGDNVIFEKEGKAYSIKSVSVGYTLSENGMLWEERDLTAAPKEIKVGSEVCSVYTKTSKGKVLAIFTEPHDNIECAVVGWCDRGTSNIEKVKNLEVV